MRVSEDSALLGAVRVVSIKCAWWCNSGPIRLVFPSFRSKPLFERVALSIPLENAATHGAQTSPERPGLIPIVMSSPFALSWRRGSRSSLALGPSVHDGVRRRIRKSVAFRFVRSLEPVSASMVAAGRGK